VHRSPSRSSRAVRLGSHPCPVEAASPPSRSSESGVVTAVVAPRRFCALSVPVPVLPLAPLLVSAALRSFRLSPALFATTAFADFPAPLRAWTSPGKAPELSPRAVGLYHPRFFDSLRTLPSLAGSSPVAGLAARSCSYGRGFAFRFFQLRLAVTPCGSATVAAIGSDDLLPCHKFKPMLGTLGQASPKPRPEQGSAQTCAWKDLRPFHAPCPRPSCSAAGLPSSLRYAGTRRRSPRYLDSVRSEMRPDAGCLMLDAGCGILDAG
jgi:hypothetical protein